MMEGVKPVDRNACATRCREPKVSAGTKLALIDRIIADAIEWTVLESNGNECWKGILYAVCSVINYTEGDT